jgi:hypothetical protein
MFPLTCDVNTKLRTELNSAKVSRARPRRVSQLAPDLLSSAVLCYGDNLDDAQRTGPMPVPALVGCAIRVRMPPLMVVLVVSCPVIQS